jgi:hypothetical protein
MKNLRNLARVVMLLPLGAAACALEGGEMGEFEATELAGGEPSGKSQDREVTRQVEGALNTSHLTCDGATCQTSPNPLPNDVDEETYWSPCNGAEFSWTGTINFEKGYDFISINGVPFDGENVVISGSSRSDAAIILHTDYSVESPGILNLKATCASDKPTPYLEAECPTQSAGAFRTVSTAKSGYSGTGHLRSVGNTTSVNSSTDTARFAFNSAAGSHSLYFRVDTNGSIYDDSWFYRVDSGSWITVNGSGNLGSGWKWVKATANVNLTVGAHTLEVRNREDGLNFDKVAILPASAAAPMGLGDRAGNCPLPEPEIGCASDTCTGGDICCGDVCTTSECNGFGGQGRPVECDSSEDCAVGSRCMVERIGNAGEIIRCLSEEAIGDPRNAYIRELCQSPAGSFACPGGQVCGPTDFLGYARCVPEVSPVIGCGSDTCSGGAICCSGTLLDSPICVTDNSCRTGGDYGFTSPRACDSPDDCVEETACALIVLTNGQGTATACVPRADLFGDASSAMELCGSPTWQMEHTCPTVNGICGPADELGYSFCLRD